MNQFFSWLQKPYPLPETKGSQFKMAVLLSLVVALFLFLFRPFNQQENTTQALSTALIGGATVFVTIYFHFLVLFPLFPRFFREERWTIGRELIWTLIVIVSIAMTNMAVIAIWGGFPVTWRNIWLVIIDTTIIGIAPATASILINQARLLRRYRRQALALNAVVHRSGQTGVAAGMGNKVSGQATTTSATDGLAATPPIDRPVTGSIEPVSTEVQAQAPASTDEPATAPFPASQAASDHNKIQDAIGPPSPETTNHYKIQEAARKAVSDSPITLSAEIGKDQVVVAPADLLAISSADNYCKVYLRDGGRVKTVILRSPLKRLEGMLAAQPHFWRCHRTAIVNLEAIGGVGGTAQGYRLEIDGMEETIPVSRSLNAQLREKLGAIGVDQIGGALLVMVYFTIWGLVAER